MRRFSNRNVRGRRLYENNDKYIELILQEFSYSSEVTRTKIIKAMNDMQLTLKQVWDWYSYCQDNNIQYNVFGYRGDSDVDIILLGAIIKLSGKTIEVYRKTIKKAIRIGIKYRYQHKYMIPSDGILNRKLLKKGDSFKYYDFENRDILTSIVSDYLDYDGVRLYFIADDVEFSMYSEMGVVVYRPASNNRVRSTNDTKELFFQSIESSKRRGLGGLNIRSSISSIHKGQIALIRQNFL